MDRHRTLITRSRQTCDTDAPERYRLLGAQASTLREVDILLRGMRRANVNSLRIVSPGGKLCLEQRISLEAIVDGRQSIDGRPNNQGSTQVV